ncbi:MAG: thioredoxin domain-containing protein [Candidatus Sumerlaeia bacterium]|nr:thioredoxin domain-containing protein [Candidatus Sumerlaeia bacterium]
MADNPPPLEEEATFTEEYWRDQHMRRVANLFVYPAGLLYLAICALLLFGEDAAPDVIGAVCTEACGGARVFGIHLEWFGGGAMALLLAIRLAAQKTLYEPLVAAAVSLAFIHGGASFILAASQWFGFADFCNLCQAAALLSFLIAIFHIPVAARAFRFPLITSLQSIVLGGFIVLAAWPLFYDGTGDVIEFELSFTDRENRTRDEGQRMEMVMEKEEKAPEVIAEPEPEQDDDTVTDVPGRELAPPTNLSGAVEILSIGREDAPWTLYILSRMGCPICRRFESLTLPVLIREAVEPGHLRIQFYYTVQTAEVRFQTFQLVAAKSLVGAGESVTSAIAHVQSLDNPMPTVPFLINAHQDEGVREKAHEFLRVTDSTLGWNPVANEHIRLSQLLRQTYLDGNTATPCTVLVPCPVDKGNLPPGSEVFAFVGYQLPDPYLEFMGLEVPDND